MDRKLQRHRADSLRQHGFLVHVIISAKQTKFSLDCVHTVNRSIRQLGH